MNLALLDSYINSYPDTLEGSLDCISRATTCCFNRLGTLLAVGCSDGRIVIWDFITICISKIIAAHVYPVSCISWSRYGYKIVSTSSDKTCSVWDVPSGDCLNTYRFRSIVLKVCFNPRDCDEILVGVVKSPAVRIKLANSVIDPIPLGPDKDSNICYSYDRRGDYILIGNNQGMIMVYRGEGLELVASFRVLTGSSNPISVKTIEFPRRSDFFLVNCGDKIIRIFDIHVVLDCGIGGNPQALLKLQDLVNRNYWTTCRFSGNGEYICAASAKQNVIYIWEMASGVLVKMLGDPQSEILLDLAWNPNRPVICSVSKSVVNIWSQFQQENWSAYAPDFQELDENVEYDERESEFDLEDEDRSVIAESLETEDLNIDVLTVNPILEYLSSDEDNSSKVVKSLAFLSISPDIDDPDYYDDVDQMTVEENDVSDDCKTKKAKAVDVSFCDLNSDDEIITIKKSAKNNFPF